MAAMRPDSFSKWQPEAWLLFKMAVVRHGYFLMTATMPWFLFKMAAERPGSFSRWQAKARISFRIASVTYLAVNMQFLISL
jgi:hypothetical protein